MKNRQILRENAYEAWAEAIQYCKSIKAGLITLQYRKQFVASLHKSVELLIKQHMLNINDYRVVEFRNIDAQGEPAKSYYSSTDLNSFFRNNDLAREKAFSIEFSKLCDLHKTLFKTYYDNNQGVLQIISDGMKLLKDLRNNETHFYIDGFKFLTEREFQTLHNFMIQFYEIQKEYQLRPFFGDPFREHIGIHFEEEPLKDFSYKSALKNSEYYKQIKMCLNQQPCSGSDDPFDIVEDLLMNHSTAQDGYIGASSYNALLSYVSSMLLTKTLTIKEEIDEYDTGDETGYTRYCWYNFE